MVKCSTIKILRTTTFEVTPVLPFFDMTATPVREVGEKVEFEPAHLTRDELKFLLEKTEEFVVLLKKNLEVTKTK